MEEKTRIVELDGKRYAVDRTFDNCAAVYRARGFETLGHVDESAGKVAPHASPLEDGMVVIVARPTEARRTEPGRLAILQAIFANLVCATQWIPTGQTTPDFSQGVTKYLFKAEALIEALEVTDCGSTGGFDPQMPKRHEGAGFFDRFLWLADKYGMRSQIKAVGNFSVADLEACFKRLSTVRLPALTPAPATQPSKRYGKAS